ncbi:sigma-70 family RNA polymerase sigma factor [Brevundimonas vitis]|uniref:Sigma-70 family RNA polymerase sigma factor n=1 Tax=Brevundimonas vitisensis TaxID=2800818 RepID=A0ABX7BPI3_9CAUL|nr:sigma-70 family RNA polymerase sigma factor [Brevundimonas vitisensis]QQQ18628.1 sigma-70 family RNA polymerase sigma factor [Brevundimonas vitisensis]
MKDGDSIEARAAGGDAGAFGALMAATKGDLYRFVRRYVGDEAEAHDLLQETYTAAWLALRRYDPARPFEVWLRSIALNKCRDWSRRRAARRVVRGVMGLDAPEASAVRMETPSPEARLDDRRRAEALRSALTRLPDGLKAPLLLATLEGRSHGEIAAILGVTTKAVETRIARARKRLAEDMAVPGGA